MGVFKKYITEAIGLDVVRKAIANKPIWDYKEKFADEFNGGYRKVIGRIESDESMLDSHPLYNSLENLFVLRKYILTKDGYIKGYVTRDKQQFKIGRLLLKWYKEDKDDDLKDFMESFRDDPLRQQNRKPYLVVVSKHPYDVLGASTDRNWVSCVNLGGGIVYSNTKSEKEKEPQMNSGALVGSLHSPIMVAYLVDPDDVNVQGKIMIQRPLSRILIYPLKGKDDGEFNFNWTIGGTDYGISHDGFRTIVYEWVSELNNKYDESNVYQRIHDVFYDNIDETLVKSHYDDYELFENYKQNKNAYSKIYIGSVGSEWNVDHLNYYIYDLSLEKCIDVDLLKHELLRDKQFYDQYFIPNITSMLQQSSFSYIYDDIDDIDIFRIYEDSGTIHMNNIQLKGIPERIQIGRGEDEVELMDLYGDNVVLAVILEFLQNYANNDYGVESSYIDSNIEFWLDEFSRRINDELLDQGIAPELKNWNQLDIEWLDETNQELVYGFNM